MAKFMNYVSRWMGPFVYKFYGVDIFGYFAWLKKTLNWSPEQRSAWRLNRLGDILEFCWNHVPFYQEFWSSHGLSFRRPRSLAELSSYPILRRDIFKKNRVRIRPDNLHLIRYQHKGTGGTTGIPIKYLQDLEHWAFLQAFHLWGWGQAGYLFGDPAGVIAGGSLIPKSQTLKSRLRSFFERKLFLFGVHMDYSLAEKYYRKIKKYKAEFLYGYPSILSSFASFLSEGNLKIEGLKGIITTGEMLQPHYRRNIEKTFGCPVFDHFGCTDGGCYSYECNLHNGLHYNDLQCILEIDDSQEDEMGQLLVTNLWNKSTPFIRYENGDCAILSESPCSCGQPFPLIKSVLGRTMDILKFANGRLLSGPALTLIFANMEIEGWQVVQRSLSRLEVRFCSKKQPRHEDANFIRRVFRYHLGDDVEINIINVDKLDTAASGKFKSVWVEFEK